MRILMLGFILFFGSEVSIASILSVSSEKRVLGCNLNLNQQQKLLNEVKSITLKSAQEVCPLDYIVNQNESLRFITSPYASDSCVGTITSVRLEFTCRQGWFSVTGVSIEGSYISAQEDALQKARSLCGRRVKRVSKWIDISRPVNYWFEYRAKAKFKCN